MSDLTADPPTTELRGEVRPPSANASRLRVALVSTWQTQCGIADYTASLASALAGPGADVQVVSVERDHIQYLTEAELAEHWERVVRRISDVDVVHIQHEFGFFAGAYGFRTSLVNLLRVLTLLRRRNLPVVVTFHTEPVFLAENPQTARAKVRHAALRLAWSRLAAMFSRDAGLRAIVHSRHSRRVLVQSGFSADAITVIPQGVTSPAVSTDAQRRASRTALGIDHDTVVLGMFGFLSAYKGYSTALAALRRLPARYRLLLVGGPHPHGGDSALEEILALRERHRGLVSRITIAGYLDEAALAAHRDAVDIWLAPYLRAPHLSSSAALSWSLASGRPIIASAIPAFRELEEVGACLELVTPERPRELAFAVERLASDPARQTRLSDAGLRYARANSWAHRADDHRAVYDTMPR